jgi:hypothetical protein
MVVAALSGIGATVFVVARLVVVAHGNASVFIVVGSAHVSASSLPRGVAVTRGSGYDGQFYYRLALDPARLVRTAFGIRLDTFSRLERIGYPVMAWLMAAGRRSVVPETLIVTNVVGLGALGLGGGLLARQSGRHALWGLTLAGYWGYLWSAGRDLTEITAAALLVLGLVAYRADRSLLAGILLLGAVLTKETAAYVVVILAATRLVGWTAKRDRRPLVTNDVAWALPLVGFLAWQAVVLLDVGVLPLGQSGEANLGLPFEGVVDGFRHYVSAFPSVASSLWMVEFAALVVLSVAAAAVIRTTSAPVHERIVWVAVVFLAVGAAPGIWLGDVGFRSLDDVYLFSWIILLGSSKRLWPLGGLAAMVWIAVAAELILYL